MKIKLVFVFFSLFLMVLSANAQVISLACNLPSGKEWGTLQIDMKQKSIIDKNVLQKLSADYIEDWKEKYNQKQGREYTPKTFNADKSSTKFTITKISDESIFGESHLWGYKSIEINRYTLQMRYPEMPSNDIFQCTKIEKVF